MDSPSGPRSEAPAAFHLLPETSVGAAEEAEGGKERGEVIRRGNGAPRRDETGDGIIGLGHAVVGKTHLSGSGKQE